MTWHWPIPPAWPRPVKKSSRTPPLPSATPPAATWFGVVTNGTAVLGLGDIGPLACKPVMEGKGVLLKKFSGIDVFDIEINEKDPDKLIEIIASLEPRSAESTWKTSRPQTASTSSASCASA